MSAPLLGMGLGLLIFANWSDAIGRCSLLLAGIAAGLCASFLLPIVESYNQFLLLRFVQGALLAVCPAVAVPLLGDELRKSWLPGAVGFYVAANTLGGITSRIIGGVCAEYVGSWQEAGYIVGGITFVCFLAVYFILPKQRRFKRSEFHFSQCVKTFARHLKTPKLMLIYMVIGLSFGCYVNLTNYLMLILGQAPYHMPSDMRSLMFLTMLGGTTSSSLAGIFSRRFSQKAGLYTGILIMLFASLLMADGQLPMMVAGMIMMSVGFFFCHAQASTLVSKSVKKGKGSAQALYSLFYYTGASCGVLFIEPFYAANGWSGVLTASRGALLGCVALLVVYQLLAARDKRHMPQHILK